MAIFGAARNNDPHICPQPLKTGGTHVGGNIQATGTSKVFVNQLPAAVEGDICICPEPGNKISKGSSSVYFGGIPAARVKDVTFHNPGGFIQTGSTNVFIGG